MSTTTFAEGPLSQRATLNLEPFVDKSLDCLFRQEGIRTNHWFSFFRPNHDKVDAGARLNNFKTSEDYDQKIALEAAKATKQFQITFPDDPTPAFADLLRQKIDGYVPSSKPLKDLTIKIANTFVAKLLRENGVRTNYSFWWNSDRIDGAVNLEKLRAAEDTITAAAEKAKKIFRQAVIILKEEECPDFQQMIQERLAQYTVKPKQNPSDFIDARVRKTVEKVIIASGARTNFWSGTNYDNVGAVEKVRDFDRTSIVSQAFQSVFKKTPGLLKKEDFEDLVTEKLTEYTTSLEREKETVNQHIIRMVHRHILTDTISLEELSAVYTDPSELIANIIAMLREQAPLHTQPKNFNEGELQQQLTTFTPLPEQIKTILASMVKNSVRTQFHDRIIEIIQTELPGITDRDAAIQIALLMDSDDLDFAAQFTEIRDMLSAEIYPLLNRALTEKITPTFLSKILRDAIITKCEETATPEAIERERKSRETAKLREINALSISINKKHTAVQIALDRANQLEAAAERLADEIRQLMKYTKVLLTQLGQCRLAEDRKEPADTLTIEAEMGALQRRKEKILSGIAAWESIIAEKQEESSALQLQITETLEQVAHREKEANLLSVADVAARIVLERESSAPTS
jgi:hypothetical protein